MKKEKEEKGYITQYVKAIKHAHKHTHIHYMYNALYLYSGRIKYLRGEFIKIL